MDLLRTAGAFANDDGYTMWGTAQLRADRRMSIRLNRAPAGRPAGGSDAPLRTNVSRDEASRKHLI